MMPVVDFNDFGAVQWRSGRIQIQNQDAVDINIAIFSNKQSRRHMRSTYHMAMVQLLAAAEQLQVTPLPPTHTHTLE